MTANDTRGFEGMIAAIGIILGCYFVANPQSSTRPRVAQVAELLPKWSSVRSSAENMPSRSTSREVPLEPVRHPSLTTPSPTPEEPIHGDMPEPVSDEQGERDIGARSQSQREDRLRNYSSDATRSTTPDSTPSTLVQSEPRVSLPESMDASGIGLRGVLDEVIPPGLQSETFQPLGNSWAEWSTGTLEQIRKLYEEPELDVSSQQATLLELRKKFSTMQTAMNDPNYRPILEPIASVHARLRRRVVLFEAVLATLQANSVQNHEALARDANQATLAALSDLEQWLRDEFSNGAAWLEFIKADAIRESISDETDELLHETVEKLSNLDSMENEAQRKFIQKPLFVKLRDCIRRKLELKKSAPLDCNESVIRSSLARLIYAVELWEVDRSTRSHTLIEEATERCSNEIPDTSRIDEALAETYLARNLLTQPSKLCDLLTDIVGFYVTWKQSRVFDGEWVTSPSGSSIEFGKRGYSTRPNLFFYVFGSRPNEIRQISLKLNLNGSPDHVEGRNRLINSMNKLLDADGRSLPDAFVNDIRSLESVADPDSEQSDEIFLRAHSFEPYRLELLYETGRYTAIVLRLVHPDPAPVDDNLKARGSPNSTTTAKPLTSD